MSSITTTFRSESIDLGNDNHFHFINISDLSSEIKACIDKNIVSICEGSSSTDLSTIKVRLINFLSPKKGTNIEMGAIAEFFTHLYLKEIGFTQQFLFLNLEEGSIKKGFDGYYLFSDKEWIYESKSGMISKNGVTHDNKIKEAYEDLRKKISGEVTNNPWQNAYSHASQIDINASPNVRKGLKKLANEFTLGKYGNIEKFNIIPGSTIFLESLWADIDVPDLTLKLKSLLETFKYKNIMVVCINKTSVSLFWEYLEN